MSFLTPVWSYVDALVHPAAQHDALTRPASDPIKLVTERNRSFPMVTNDRVKKSA